MEGFFDFFAQSPEYIGLFIAAVGALIMVGAILKWGWIIGRDHTGNTVRTGLFGWLIYKLFGRRVFFIVTGAMILLLGLGWFFLFGYLTAAPVV